MDSNAGTTRLDDVTDKYQEDEINIEMVEKCSYMDVRKESRYCYVNDDPTPYETICVYSIKSPQEGYFWKLESDFIQLGNCKEYSNMNIFPNKQAAIKNGLDFIKNESTICIFEEWMDQSNFFIYINHAHDKVMKNTKRFFVVRHNVENEQEFLRGTQYDITDLRTKKTYTEYGIKFLVLIGKILHEW